MITSNERLLLDIIKVALDKGTKYALSDAFDWNALFDLSMKQCVPAIVLDGLNKWLTVNNKQQSDNEKYQEIKKCKLRWLGLTLQMERQYAIHEKVISDLADFYDNEGFMMMLLKGYGLSKLWPIPNHRPVGDIDIYLLEKDECKKYEKVSAWKRADSILQRNLNIKVDNSHHHHSVFTYKGIMVENHYDFVNVHSHRSNRWIEKVFKSLALTGCEEYTSENGSKLLFPSPLLNCLFVARHNASHFAAEHLNLRQLLDWSLLVDNRNKDIDWEYFWNTAKKMGMEKFVLCMTFIAIEQLSFEKEIFHIPDEYADFHKSEHKLIDMVFDNILHPTDVGNNGKGIAYVINRYRLWKKHLWKHKIVYSDSVFSTFCAQIKSHIMKPATILGV